MKRYIQFFTVVALVATAVGVSSCQKEDVLLTRTPSDEALTQESLTGTRSDDFPLCTITTDTLCQVESKLKAYAEENSTVVEALFKISIEGPVNQKDIDYLKSLPYVDSLSLEKSLYHDTEGKQSAQLPEGCFRGFTSQAAVVMPENIKIMPPSCFRSANIRAIYMDKVEIMQETTGERWIDSDGIGYAFRYEDGISMSSDYTGEQFAHCNKLKAVKLSDKVASIPRYAFYDCSALEQIILPSSLTEIRRGAFASTGLTELSMPAKLITLEDQVFRNCSSLAKVTPNEALKYLGNAVFRGCFKLESFAFPEIILNLGINTFLGDAKLTEVTWPKSFKAIPESTFSGCEKLKFTIPDYITSLGSYAFYCCKAITEATIPASVESFGVAIFAYSGLSSFANGINWIPDRFYQGCQGFTEVTIPETMTSVGNAAFANCPNLTSVTIQGSTIGDDAFRDCQALKQVTVEKCDYIGSCAFYENQAMKKVSIQECGDIGSHAFHNCDALSDLSIKGCGNIGYEAFVYCDGFKQVSIDYCAVIDHDAFAYCQGLKEMTIGECKGLEDNVFYSCPALTKLTILKMEDGYIGRGCLFLCDNLTEVNLPEGIVSISENAFGYCHRLQNITIPSSVEKAEAGIFNGCENLRYVNWLSNKVTIPNLNKWSRDSNPNLLVFAPAGASSDSGNPNVIIDGKASRITVHQGLFYTPRSFTADEVVFEMDLGADRWKNTTTGTGVAARWNTIAVPFTVTSIKSAGKGDLAPFGTDAANSGKAKPFWLCELTSEGFKDATTIEANKPYIFAMPNNPNYVDEYNIQDLVTFTGTNATFAASTDDQQASSPAGPAGWALTPLYHDSADASLMAINWDGFNDKSNTWHPVGNCFRLNARTANAFEAVITATSASAAATRSGYIPLGGATTRSSKPLGRIPQREDMPLP